MLVDFLHVTYDFRRKHNLTEHSLASASYKPFISSAPVLTET